MQTQNNRPIVPITSLTHFKNCIRPSVDIHVVYHKQFRDADGNIVTKDEDRGIREVSIKQTDRFALKTTKEDGEIVDSWCYYPKASECEIKEGKLLIYEEDAFENKRRLAKTFALIAK